MSHADEVEDDDFDALAQRLRESGLTVEGYLTGSPVQILGRLPNGEGYYFRGRGRECSLSVYSASRTGLVDDIASTTYPDYQGATTSHLDGMPFEEFEAGCLGARQAEALFHSLLHDYLTGS